MPTESVIHFQSTPGATPRTPYDNLPIPARKIYKHEESQAEQAARRYDTEQDQRTELRRRIAAAKLEAAQNDRTPKPSEELAKDCARRIAEDQAELAASEQSYEAEKQLQPGHFFNDVRQFANENVHRKLKPRNFTCEISGDPRADHDACRAARQAQRDEAAAISRAPMLAQDIEATIDRFASDAPTIVAQAVRRLRRPEARMNGRFSSPSLELPMTTIANGVGGLTKINDTATLLFALFGDEVRERLKKLALAGHDDAKAIPLADRPAMLKKIDAEILEIERRAEAIYRAGRARGINTGPRIGAHPLAILDLDFA